MSLTTLTKINNQLDCHLIHIRRELHQYPELSNEEFQTTKRLRKWLEDVDIKILDLPLKTGLVAEISGDPSGPTIAIRADIDALPIQEEAEVDYTSMVPGVMHACGHDYHTATILGAAYQLKAKEQSLPGTIRVIFQPAEETGHGASSILATKALDDVEAIFGFHNNPFTRVGQLGVKEGVISAGVDRFEIHVKGKGSHAARPYEGIDPIIIATQIITSLQTIVSRQISSQENVVISVTQMHSGTTWNVIPETSYIEGTVRTFNEELRSTIPQKIENIISGIASAYDAKATLEWFSGPPSVNNDAEWTDFSREIAKSKGYEILEIQPSSGGEDFSFYQQKIKGSFVQIGVSGDYPLHHPKFTLDDRAIADNAQYFSALAEQALHKLLAKK